MTGKSTAFAVILIVALLTSLAACWSADKALRAKTNGTEDERGLMRGGWITVTAISLIIHIIMYNLLFRPGAYVFIMALICVIEWITIRANSIEPGKTEPMANLVRIWVYFGLSFEVGLFYSAARLADIGALAGSRGREVLARILLCFVPLLAVMLVGLLRICLVEKTAYTAEVEAEVGKDEEPENLDGLEDVSDAETAENAA